MERVICLLILLPNVSYIYILTFNRDGLSYLKEENLLLIVVEGWVVSAVGVRGVVNTSVEEGDAADGDSTVAKSI